MQKTTKLKQTVQKQVTLQGFEPRTSASVVRCSIQLSYRANLKFIFIDETAYSMICKYKYLTWGMLSYSK